MKHLLLISVLFITLVGCKKTSNTPAPAAPPTTQSTTSALTQQEQNLVGTWLMDSLNTYMNNVITYHVTYTNTLTCKTSFYSTQLVNSTDQFNCDMGHVNCTLVATSWKAPNTGYVTVANVQYGIMLLTANNLILVSGGGPAGENRYYLHK